MSEEKSDLQRRGSSLYLVISGSYSYSITLNESNINTVMKLITARGIDLKPPSMLYHGSIG